MNELQSIFNVTKLPLNIKLPQIIVVGAQSSGKTSVLESIVGKDFLPRGSGIVTRTPVILQLSHTSSGDDYAIFEHKPEVIYKDFEKVREEITNQTIRIAGEGNDISDSPIILKIFSPYILDLTLVDLPGLTKVAVGDQPENICDILHDLVMSFITNPDSIILAVSPANVDIANSDSLHLAREVDPKGNRTIGVLTKLDLMDKSTDASKVLEGRDYVLKLGYVGVVCRSEKDIKTKKPLSEALQSEEIFFHLHPEYSKVKNQCGIQNLVTNLNRIFVMQIKNCLPNLKSAIDLQLKNRTDELRSYGYCPKDKNAMHNLIITSISNYARYFRSCIDTGFDDKSILLSTGAHINAIINDYLKKSLEALDPLKGLSDKEIRTAIVNAKGLNIGLFVPESAFEALIKLQIEQCINPSLSCALQVYGELDYLASHPKVAELAKYKKLEEAIINEARKLIQTDLEPTNEKIKAFLESERGYINLEHPDVLDGTKAIIELMEGSSEMAKEFESFASLSTEGKLKSSVVSTKTAPSIQIQVLGFDSIDSNYNDLDSIPEVLGVEEKATTKDSLEMLIIKKLIVSYFKVLIVRVADIIPKIIVDMLIEKVMYEMDNRLISNILEKEDFDKLIEEDSGIAEKRSECETLIKKLNKAQTILRRINLNEIA